MNLFQTQPVIVGHIFKFWLILRRLIPRKKCHAFGVRDEKESKQIEKIYVINLDREPSRWSKVMKELKRILDSKGMELHYLTVRHVAVDANDFSEDPIKDSIIDPFYTLDDQLFVEPQPLTLPTQLELNSPIQMTRSEWAVARSHIQIWEQIAAGDHEYVLILEDDVWFHMEFARNMDKVWKDVITNNEIKGNFDILYLSYLEVKHGAPKTNLTRHLFRPIRGLWQLSGYVLSKRGAKKLISLLPSHGPIDLWINHQFKLLNVLAAKKSLISQRRDIRSSNSYSILPSLTSIGAINSENASLFHIRPTEQPVFAFGPVDSGLSSLAMALSMLGYRCCSDFQNLPTSEMQRLLEGNQNRIFNAYVNIGALSVKISELKLSYPKAKFILTSARGINTDPTIQDVKDNLECSDFTIVYKKEPNKWQIICEHLRCAPPRCGYPVIKDIGQRSILNEVARFPKINNSKIEMRDKSPWIIESKKGWYGIDPAVTDDWSSSIGSKVNITDPLEYLDESLWMARSDTFTDNLALFRPSNVKFRYETGAVLSVQKESVGIREYTAGSICSQDQYLYGRFEATIKVSNIPGVVTGFFLHRNSPRQEIDIEISGNRPNRLLVNVFYNPGGEGASFDYGYRGSPSFIDLGFDSSKESHRFAIEWSPNEIRWLVDEKLVHRRVIWDPTPIPHLPMMLHANIWLTRSTKLAGTIRKRNLPTTSIFREIKIDANKFNLYSNNH